MKVLLIISSFFIYRNSIGQFFKASLEPFIGLNYYHSVRSSLENPPYQGVESLLAVKLYGHIGNRILFSAGAGTVGDPSDGEMFLSVTGKFIVWKNYETGFSCFAETGIETLEFDDTFMPFYIGTNQNFGNGVSFNFRLRIPTFLDVVYFYDVNHFKVGVECGLQFVIPKFRKPKPLTVFGNPFILN